jgi:alkylation response protein AidB-like acyl-CoA dehydrogenase
MGYFMIPNPSPGLTLAPLNLLHGSRQKIVTMDNVRVPADHLIGGDHEGWQVMGTHLEAEHGGHGATAPRAEEVENMVDYLKETKYNNGTLGEDLVTQQVAMEAVLEAHVQSLLVQRTYWMYQSHRPIQYEGNLSNVHGRESGLRNAQRVREVYGMPVFLGVNEGTAPHGGAQEVSQRTAAGQRHAGGSTNIAKVILARRIGISRTQERAATTPSTATS